MPHAKHPSAPFLPLVLVLILVTPGCGEPQEDIDYVARVGDRYLMEEDVQGALAEFPTHEDSVDARRQIIEQWVTTETLHQEALRRGLQNEPDVQEQLLESERSVLVNALVTRLYEEDEAAPAAAELQSYFERYREQLRLRESFVRVRYLAASTLEAAEDARRALQEAEIEERDSVYALVVEQLASDPGEARALSDAYHPESRLFAAEPALHDAVAGLIAGQTSPVVESDSSYHVLQLAERIPAGTIPEPEWIEDELRRRLLIQGRKQLYARQVQRLRNEALAREDLEIR